MRNTKFSLQQTYPVTCLRISSKTLARDHTDQLCWVYQLSYSQYFWLPVFCWYFFIVCFCFHFVWFIYYWSEQITGWKMCNISRFASQNHESCNSENERLSCSRSTSLLLFVVHHNAVAMIVYFWFLFLWTRQFIITACIFLHLKEQICMVTATQTDQ